MKFEKFEHLIKIDGRQVGTERGEIELDPFAVMETSKDEFVSAFFSALDQFKWKFPSLSKDLKEKIKKNRLPDGTCLRKIRHLYSY